MTVWFGNEEGKDARPKAIYREAGIAKTRVRLIRNEPYASKNEPANFSDDAGREFCGKVM